MGPEEFEKARRRSERRQSSLCYKEGTATLRAAERRVAILDIKAAAAQKDHRMNMTDGGGLLFP